MKIEIKQFFGKSVLSVYVKRALFRYSCKDKKLKSGLKEVACNAFKEAINEGKSAKDALKIGAGRVDYALFNQFKFQPLDIKKYNFSLLWSTLLLFCSFVITLCAYLGDEAYWLLFNYTLITLIASVILFIYALCTLSKRTWLDFLILLIFILVYSLTFSQIVNCYYRRFVSFGSSVLSYGPVLGQMSFTVNKYNNHFHDIFLGVVVKRNGFDITPYCVFLFWLLSLAFYVRNRIQLNRRFDSSAADKLYYESLCKKANPCLLSVKMTGLYLFATLFNMLLANDFAWDLFQFKIFFYCLELLCLILLVIYFALTRKKRNAFDWAFFALISASVLTFIIQLAIIIGKYSFDPNFEYLYASYAIQSKFRVYLNQEKVMTGADINFFTSLFSFAFSLAFYYVMHLKRTRGPEKIH